MWGQAAALNVLGWLYVAQERFEGHEVVFRSTVTTSTAAGDQQLIAMGEVNLAEYLVHEGNVGEALALLASCVSRHRTLRLMYSIAYLLDGVARMAVPEENATSAARLVGAASHLRVAAGMSVWGS